MKKYRFKGLMKSTGWIDDVSVTVNAKGIIDAINHDHSKSELVEGFVIPGFQNAHSHAFQYAMAGLAEQHIFNNHADDFWGWREVMYQIALTMSPDDLESVASMLYSEMVRHGYTHVAEFHYLHHGKDGESYSNLSEHGERLIVSAKRAGIKITLIPMFYQKGGFGEEPQLKQRRFISKTIDEYYRLLESSEKSTENYKDASLGYGIHSLRAVEAKDIKTVLANKNLKGPFHIHIAEQLKEVENSKNFLNRRPVEWLLENVEVDGNFHLVHATHLTTSEISGITESKANVVLCPSTEGNLGDGIFPLREFQELGGKWSIGTDSHVGLNPCEELRLLDYGQRLTSHRRDTFISKDYCQSGEYGYNQAIITGRRAMGNSNKKYFEVGQPFDAVVYDAKVPLLNMSSKDNRLSTIIYSSDAAWVKGTIVNGHWVVKDQIHNDRDSISSEFTKALSRLKIR